MKCPKCGGLMVEIESYKLSLCNLPASPSAIKGWNPIYLRCIDCNYTIDP